MDCDDVRATLPDGVPPSSQSWPESTTSPGAHPDVASIGVLPACPEAAKALSLVADTPVGELADPDAPKITAMASLATLQKLLVESGASGVIVVDEGARPVGTVHPRDLLAAGDRFGADASVAQVMELGAFEVAADTPLEEVVAMIATQSADVVAVVDTTRRVIGGIGAHDIVRWLTACRSSRRRRERRTPPTAD